MDVNKYLVINADDFGYCTERNKAIFELLDFNSGLKSSVITSTSVMVTAAAFHDAIHLKKYTNISIGLHFNLTEGKPSVAKKSSGLLNENEYFLGKTQMHQALINQKVDLEAVEEELEFQLQIFEKFMGQKPHHVDGHQHVHIFPGVREIFTKVLSKYGIQWTRIPLQLSIENCTWLNETRKQFFTLLIPDAIEAEKLFSSANIKFAKPFLGLTTMGFDMTIDRLKSQIMAAFTSYDGKDSITAEFMVHPGFMAKPGIGGCGEGPDEFSMSKARLHEMNILKSQEFQDFLQKNNIQLRSFQ